jgi:ribosomal-protein-alanine acetyltransferase
MEPRVASVRVATLADVPALLRIEDRCFSTDRLTRRSFNHLLRRGNATCLVATEGDVLAGYALLLFNAGTSLARLYSFAVDPDHRRKGIAEMLLEAGEKAAVDHDAAYIRLEVRRDNTPAIALYKKHGYREFGTFPDYYEDHMEALRLEKRLQPSTGPGGIRVPFYEQTTDFTCGAAALMMAMRALDLSVELTRKLELRIWRESTTIFMTSGHGGTGPFGLALAAWNRGFNVQLYVNDERPSFLDSVRNESKKEVMRIVHEEQAEELSRTGVELLYQPFTPDILAASLAEGAIPVVLISSYRIYREKFPHWVVVTGNDDKFFYVHDPLVEYEKHQTATDRINMPIPKREFERMAKYGKAQLKAAVILRPRRVD